MNRYPIAKRRSLITPSTSDLGKICGLDVVVVAPCRCGCPLVRVHPHSVKSRIPIWKCVWCRKRRDRPTNIQLRLLEDFVRQYGWLVEPLVFHEDGGVYRAYGELS